MTLLRRAFTLIELLVVVAIIAVLIAILLPSLGAARQKAKTAKCLANVKNMGMAVQFYVADWRRMMPFVNQFKPEVQWTQLLRNSSSNYGGIDKVRICPEAPDARRTGTTPWFGTAHFAWGGSLETGPDPVTGKELISGYGLNGFVYSYTSDMSGIGGNAGENYTLPNVKNESQIPLFLDCIWRHMTPHSSDAPSTSGNVEEPGPNNQQGAMPISYAMLNRHKWAVNVSFFDGHASTVTLRELYSLQWSVGWTPPGSIPTIPTK